MREKFKLSKILATVILTVLIWVWADLALDEEFSFSNAQWPAVRTTFGCSCIDQHLRESIDKLTGTDRLGLMLE